MELKNRNKRITVISTALFLILFALSLFVGKYPLSFEKLLAADETTVQIFLGLRLGRTLLSAAAGMALGISGFVFQTVFRNPLAAPDIIGVSSGASVGAAAGILLFSGGFMVTLSSFAGAIFAMLLALFLASLDKNRNCYSIVLSGIAVHALAQSLLMLLKISADPGNELAAIEYWIMGSLSGIVFKTMIPSLILCIVCMLCIVLLQRQTLMLSIEDSEAKTLGVNVNRMRFIVLGIATLCVASVVSLTGIISFIGLLAPHIARKLLKKNDTATLVLSAVLGGIILCAADTLVRCFPSELPISILTSLIGAPFLICLVVRREH